MHLFTECCNCLLKMHLLPIAQGFVNPNQAYEFLGAGMDSMPTVVVTQQ